MTDRSTPVAGLLLRSLVYATAFVATYLVMVRLAPGQRLDDLAFEGRKAVRLDLRRATTAVMGTITPLLLAGGGIGAVALAIRQRRWRIAALLAFTVGGTVLSARLLKSGLQRTDNLAFSYATTANTFPSGHAATIMGLALTGIALCPARLRRRVVMWAVAAVVVDVSALVGSGWHRPSDVVGGLLLAAAFVPLGVALFGADLVTGPDPGSAPGEVDAGPPPARMLVVVAVGTLVSLLLALTATSDPAHPLYAFAVAALLVNLLAALTVWIHLRQMDACSEMDDVART